MSIKSFSDYIVESSKEATFTFGRYNPPTIGHEVLFNKVKDPEPFFVNPPEPEIIPLKL